ncbi:ferric-chelate reductase [Phyllosticta citricarpa]|uniref:ferric-chelate reductase (NADPH) n=2 Tax=Phyllosticta TaxID=121621 RepID=A0ABR1MKN5_9PEZI
MKIRRHDMSSMDMGGMGGMSSSSPSGLPSLQFFQKMYWAVVGAFIAAATLVNITNYVIYRQRLWAAQRGDPTPAKPKSLPSRINATATAILREATNSTFAPLVVRGFRLRLPTVGNTFLVLANAATLLVLCFYGFNLSDRWSFEDVGYRTGCMSVAQLPLIFLLAGKNNIVGWLTGSSYERLNWLHRWVSRTLLLTVTIHMGYWFGDWAPYNYIGDKIRTDSITQHGLISWCLLLWITFSSAAPIRGWRYEVFVIQHLVSFAIFLAFVYKHVSSWPMYVRVYVWIPVALVCFDRFVRAAWMLYTNVSFFHPKPRRNGDMSGIWACKAEFTPLPHNTTRVTIKNPSISWNPGQHVFLSCHSVVPLQSHPFSIASIPGDKQMEFYIKSENGATKRFLAHAEKVNMLPANAASAAKTTKAVTIDGPYGQIRPLRQFDSVVLFAGSTGATFIMPLLRDLVAHWQTRADSAPHKRSGLFSQPVGAIATRRVRLVWVVKSRGQLSWFASQLSLVQEQVAHLRSSGVDVDVESSVYVTCDPSFTEEHKSQSTTARPSRVVEEQFQSPNTVTDPFMDEKKRASSDRYSQNEVDDSNASTLGEGDEKNAQACPGYTCCCTATVEDEDAISAVNRNCTCGANPDSNKTRNLNAPVNGGIENPTNVPSPPSSPPPFTPLMTSPSPSSPANNANATSLHPSIHVLAGRPHLRCVTRKCLEQALGETAVVACGPIGLVDDCRDSVVRLSDERAVHKGTGAQGIWFHGERFGW